MQQPHKVIPQPKPGSATLLGVPAFETQPALQQDAFKELINKLAWALGSTYRHSYSGTRSNVRVYARELARIVIAEQGYPAAISK